ncbi:ferritin [Thermotomaculum hydrothermale]|uniref:Ferritin n=1 Tax=Thermotomaculum hydrothermale TaxID=981385 RepID=A0A7R6Q0L3_9BACT|nr:ferritin [Thermotomaculum hydrothermale]BBB33343.1 ferritin [Thermotomaculum hydrothermale]
MFDKKMEEALNKQLNEELFSAYLYLSMSAWFDSIGLKGFANWMMVQYKEETEHAMKFYNYIQTRGGDIKLMAIKEPPSKWDSPLHAFKETLKHEQFITKCINELVDLAEELKDRPTMNFLQWFIDEQVEEEENDRDIIHRLELIGDSKHGLFMLDRELGERTYTPETD